MLHNIDWSLPYNNAAFLLVLGSACSTYKLKQYYSTKYTLSRFTDFKLLTKQTLSQWQQESSTLAKTW